MINKKGHPEIKPADKIIVEGLNCVVSQVYGKFSVIGACEVVVAADSPVCKDVCWDGKQWVFSQRPTFVDATKSARLKPFIEML
ncbi:hypothetical protein SAMN02745165_01144 [Malonomonas rubra DSM 5091]|uniref:Uncharacterized protein n=1 Tax=Malonomonas rubra DSM 5091 TaxID=1122189 RepID=A0A1M6F3N9_MALRU|nr:hypothetical protein [Malonomonas rubra]SHI92280.1 hypothetical protein SAMN02745165_01144 [Malonomonas rubra DSM 5091]